MKEPHHLLVALACSALAAAGCGGNAANCAPASSSCGGNLVGTWKFSAGSCSVEFGGGTLAMNGDWTLAFGASGSYSATGAGTNFVFTWPPSSFGADAGLAFSSCADLTLAASTQAGTCTGGGSANCVCTYPVVSLNNSGTYSTSGTRMTLPLAGVNGATTTSDYCVDESKLRFLAQAGNSALFA